MRQRWGTQSLATLAGVVVLAGAVLVGLVGCKSNLGDELSASKEDMEKAASGAWSDLLAARADSVKETFEGRKGLEGDGHELRRWRLASIGDDCAERANTGKKSHNRTTFKSKFEDAEQFLKEQKDYWADTKGRLNGYMAFLKQFITRDEAGKGPFIEHARFEREFIFVDHYLKAQDWPEDTRLTSFYRYWKYAFDFWPKKREPFMPYVTRLCAARLADYCKPLMYEHRPYAMNKPYLEQLIKNMEKFRADFPDSAYDPIAKHIIELYMADLGEMPKFEEYPVLAEGRTVKDSVGGNELVWAPKGATWNGIELLVPEDGGLELDKKKRAELVAALDEQLTKMLKSEGEHVDDPQIPLVVTQIDAKARLMEVAGLFGMLLDRQVNELGLIMRRRADGTNRKVGTYLAAFYTPPPLNEDVESRKSKEQKEKEEIERREHDPRRKVPTKMAGMTCRAIGRTGKLMAMPKQPTTFLAITKKMDVVMGGVQVPESFAEETAKATPSAKTIKGGDLAKVLEIIETESRKAKDPFVLAVHNSLPYHALTDALQRAYIDCADDKCVEATERDVQISISLCQ